MRKIAILLIALMVIGVGLLSGCNEKTNSVASEESRFVGTWQGMVGGIIPQGITFFSDGTGSLAGGSMTWELKEGKLVLYSAGGEATIIYDYTFSNNDNTLTLKEMSSGLETDYTKQ